MQTTRRFGIEIEAKGLNTHQASRALTAAGVANRHEGHTHNGRPGVSAWSVCYDGSLSGSAFEAVAPPARDTDQIAPVCEALRSAGARVDRECGLHVHVEIADYTIDDWKRLARLWLSAERALDHVLARSRRGGNNRYCLSNLSLRRRSLAQAHAAIAEASTVREVAHEVTHGRYYKFNPLAFWRHGTVEFRAHQGTLNATKISAWVRLMIGLVDAAKNGYEAPARAMTLAEVLEVALPSTTPAPASAARRAEATASVLSARRGTINAQLYELFERHHGELSPSLIYDRAEQLGILRHTARRAYSDWRRALNAPSAAPAAPQQAADQSALRSWFLERAAQLARAYGLQHEASYVLAS
jgi:hypothetical protein